MFVPTIWLSFLGAAIASGGAGSDPAQLIITAFGVMALPVLLVLLHGPIATNIVVIYSAALATLALDVRLPRWTVSVASDLVAVIILYLFLQSGDFAHSFENAMVAMVVWISPRAGITLADFFLLRGGRVDVPALYEPHDTCPHGDVNWAGISALGLGVVAAWSCQMGSIELAQGPIALALGGIDLSWLAGLLVGGGSYVVMQRRNPSRKMPGTPIAPAATDTSIS